MLRISYFLALAITAVFISVRFIPATCLAEMTGLDPEALPTGPVLEDQIPDYILRNLKPFTYTVGPDQVLIDGEKIDGGALGVDLATFEPINRYVGYAKVNRQVYFRTRVVEEAGIPEAASILSTGLMYFFINRRINYGSGTNPMKTLIILTTPWLN